MTIKSSCDNFWEIKSKSDFEKSALATFNFQYKNNPVYRSFCDLINKNLCEIKTVEEIPHLPISLFKSRKVVSFQEEPSGYFVSSSTSDFFHQNISIVILMITPKASLKILKTCMANFQIMSF